jgi:hypothetical protein
VLGGEFEETQQRPEVVAKLLSGLRPLRTELVVEGLGGVSGMFAVLGVSYLGEHLLRERLDGLGQGVEDVRRIYGVVATVVFWRRSDSDSESSTRQSTRKMQIFFLGR